MRKIIFILMAGLIFASCNPRAVFTEPAGGDIPTQPETTRLRQEAAQSTIPPEKTVTQPETGSSTTVTPQTAAQSTLNVEQQPGFVEYTSGSFWLHLSSPRDEETFSSPQITVEGQAPAETVISVNQEIVLVGEDEVFSIPLNLDEGPNIIELTASSPDGDVIELVLTVVYEKE